MLRSLRTRYFTIFQILALVLIASACGGSMAQLQSATPGSGTARPAAQFLTPRATPGSVNFPIDDGPHDDLTEWWYFTGHLKAGGGEEYGFEFVIFQGKRAGFPPAYAAHFAITDVSKGTFHYDQRTQAGGQPNPTNVIDLKLGDWSLTGNGSRDQISAKMSGYTLNLTVDARKPPALHDGDGYFEWAPATGSYYYSRTAMTANGSLSIDGTEHQVTGRAWMDHQWGNFLLIGGGGWDWYSIQLDNGQEIMLWHSRDSQNEVIFGSGTVISPSGSTRALGFSDFSISATGSWTSPHSGVTYPSGWTIDISSENLNLKIDPVIRDQELDTRRSTGVIYWEGDVRISGTEKGQPVTGQGYVELTGYAQASATP